MTGGPADPAARGPLGLPLLVTTITGLVIAGYLVAARVMGESPVCGPLHGCETVATSEYATLFGVLPVAVLGFGLSVVLVGSTFLWWRGGDRRVLQLAYGLLLLSTVFVAYLTYLELFVIQAICAWCVAYAVATVTALALAALALRRSTP